MNREWLVSAKLSLANAKTELVYSIRAFERTEVDFRSTTKAIKETIGDLEVCIEAINEHLATTDR